MIEPYVLININFSYLYCLFVNNIKFEENKTCKQNVRFFKVILNVQEVFAHFVCKLLYEWVKTSLTDTYMYILYTYKKCPNIWMQMNCRKRF